MSVIIHDLPYRFSIHRLMTPGSSMGQFYFNRQPIYLRRHRFWLQYYIERPSNGRSNQFPAFLRRQTISA